MAADIQKAGGIITAKDLASYTATSSKAITSTFRGYRVITTPPPTSGPVLLSILNILEKMNLKKEMDAASAHKYCFIFINVLGS